MHNQWSFVHKLKLPVGWLSCSLPYPFSKKKVEKKNPHIISNGGATGAATLGAICLCSIHKLKGLCLHLYANCNYGV